MNRFVMLLKREYWEHRGGFFWTPIVISSLMLVLMITALVAVRFGLAEADQESLVMAAEELTKFSNLPYEMKAKGMSGMLVQPATLMSFVLYIVVFFYLLGSLFDDRKDRSILFWKSLPVSDVAVVMSKLVMGLIVAPLIYTVFISALQVLMLVAASIGATTVADVPVWSTFWAPSQLHLVILLTVVSSFYYALWLLPIAGWLMLASSMARRAPFLYAVIPPALVAIGEMLLAWFGVIPGNGFGFLTWLGRQLTGGIDFNTLEKMVLPMDEMIISIIHPSNLLSVSLISGIVVGAGLIAGAVMLRRYYPEI